MMEQANVWQVLFVALLLVIVCYALARIQHARKVAEIAKQNLPPAHIARLRELLAEAQSKSVEFACAADHSRALAEMYQARVLNIKSKLSSEENPLEF